MEEKSTNGTIFRVKKDKNFTVMSNYHLNDINLSLKAKGLLSLILSLPPNWNYSKLGLISICKENETAVTSALNELKQYGYLVINKLKNEKSQFYYEYTISETPELQNPAPGNPAPENPVLDFPVLENHVQLNTNIINTKKISTNRINPVGVISEQKITTEILEKENNKKSNSKISAPAPASKPDLSAFSRLGTKTKSKLIDLTVDDQAKNALKDYCLALQDDYNLKDSAICNRISDIVRKARGVSSAICVICSYNINGGYKTLYFPSEKQIRAEMSNYIGNTTSEPLTAEEIAEEYTDEEVW